MAQLPCNYAAYGTGILRFTFLAGYRRGARSTGCADYALDSERIGCAIYTAIEYVLLGRA
jgi:hypothetical protein